MLLLAHKKCQEATLALACKRARPPGPAALRIEMVEPANGTTRLKVPERILVCAKRMDVASCRIPTSSGRSSEVSGGYTGSWRWPKGWRWAYIITVSTFLSPSPASNWNI